MREAQQKSIRVRLVEIFVIVSVTVFAIVIFIYYNLNRTIREMDTVYNSNIQFNELSSNVTHIQDSLYQYLNTKSSDALEDYYRRRGIEYNPSCMESDACPVSYGAQG